MPPLYRLSRGPLTLYARDDAHKEALLASEFTGRGQGRDQPLQGLGEMPAAQLKTTTMDPRTRGAAASSFRARPAASSTGGQPASGSRR
ncbi:MAG: hypothetical protein U1E35_07005 [Rhodospirillales bacterium]